MTPVAPPVPTHPLVAEGDVLIDIMDLPKGLCGATSPLLFVAYMPQTSGTFVRVLTRASSALWLAALEAMRRQFGRKARRLLTERFQCVWEKGVLEPRYAAWAAAHAVSIDFLSPACPVFPGRRHLEQLMGFLRRPMLLHLETAKPVSAAAVQAAAMDCVRHYECCRKNSHRQRAIAGQVPA